MSLKSNISDDTEHKINNNKNIHGLEKQKTVSKTKQYNTLSEFIAANNVGFGTKQETHMVWSSNYDKSNINFKVDDDDYEKFLELYIADCRYNFGKMSVLEKPCDMGPLILDYDLKQVCKNRTITSDDTLIVVEIINNIIKKYYDIDDDDMLTAYVLIKKEPFHLPEKKCYSDGFHIHYPNVVIPSEQRFLIFDESKKEIIRRNLFSEVFNVLSKTQLAVQKAKDNEDNDTENLLRCDDSDIEEDEQDDDINYYDKLTDIEKEEIHNDVFDESVILRNKWFLYGSGKNINGKWNVYQLSYIFNADGSKVDDEDRPSLGKLIKILSIRCNEESSIELKNSEEIKKKLDKIKNKYVTKTVNKKLDIGKVFIKNEDDEDDEVPKANKKEEINKLKQVVDGETDKNITAAKKLLKILRAERAYGYDDWIRVGWALYDTSQTLLPDFISFSKRSPSKYKDGCCEKVWRDCDRITAEDRVTGYTIGSLYHWAKEDNPEAYEQFRKETLNSSLESGDISRHDDVAEIIYNLYKHEFVCSSCKKNEWWQFKNHRWQKLEEDVTLSQNLSKEVSVKFQRLAIDYYTKSAASTGMQSDLYNKKGNEIKKLADNLRDVTYKKKIMMACKEKFYTRNFDKGLDQNNFLVGFENGVYDLNAGKFRPGYPDDLVARSTGYKYREFTRNDPIIQDIEKFFRSIQPEEDMLKYIMCYIASLFEGSNKDQKFMVWTGCHAIDQGIMMADGSIKKVQDIKEGEQLMGDDSKPRQVLKLIRGNDTMCEIIPYKGDAFKVNLDHILSLTATDTISYAWSGKENRFKFKWQELTNGIPICKVKNFPVKYENKQIYKKSTVYYDTKELAISAINDFKETLLNNSNVIKKGDVIDISVRDYIKHSKQFGQNNYYLFKTGIEYSEQKLDIDPYLIGYWLGDGISATSRIVTAEKEIVEYFQNNIKEYGLTLNFEREYHYRISSGIKKKGSNHFLTSLQKYNLINNKHIPKEFMFNSRENRLKLLAGIIDSDGHYQRNMKQYEITFKSEKLFDDVLFLARSLGFSAYKYTKKAKCGNTSKTGTYFRMNITGMDMNLIPSLLERKQCKETERRKNPLLTGFKINILDVKENYYGFSVDGNNRYLMDDFTVTHNCGSNGKGTLIGLIKDVLGQYYCTLDQTAVTQKRGNSSSATPELADKVGVRSICLQEPNNDDKLNLGFVKSITGQDEIQVRPLYGEPFYYVPQFKLLLACNDLPNIPDGGDGGIWRRIRVIPFEQKFVLKPSGPGEQLLDKTLKEKMKTWGPALAWLLLNVYYPIYKDGDLDEMEPERVKLATRKYECDSNIFIEFMNQYVVFDPRAQTDKNTLWEIFKQWYGGAYEQKPPALKKLLEFFTKQKDCNVKPSCIKGIIVRDRDEQAPNAIDA